MYRSGWPEGFVVLTPATHFWMFTSVSLGSSPCSYSFTSATVQITVHTGATKTGKNLSDMWRSSFKIRDVAQLHSVTKMVLKSLFCSVADPGEGPRGSSHPSYFSDQTEDQRAKKSFSVNTPPPPCLRDWMTAPSPSHCCCVNRSPVRYGFWCRCKSHPVWCKHSLGFFILIRSLNNKCMTELLWFVGLGPRKFRSRAIELGDQSVWTDTPADKARKVVLFIQGRS